MVNSRVGNGDGCLSDGDETYPGFQIGLGDPDLGFGGSCSCRGGIERSIANFNLAFGLEIVSICGFQFSIGSSILLMQSTNPLGMNLLGSEFCLGLAQFCLRLNDSDGCL